MKIFILFFAIPNLIITQNINDLESFLNLTAKNKLQFVGNKVIQILEANMNQTEKKIRESFSASMTNLSGQIDYTSDIFEKQILRVKIFKLAEQYIFLAQKIYMELKRFEKRLLDLKIYVCKEDSDTLAMISGSESHQPGCYVFHDYSRNNFRHSRTLSLNHTKPNIFYLPMSCYDYK